MFRSIGGGIAARGLCGRASQKPGPEAWISARPQAAQGIQHGQRSSRPFQGPNRAMWAVNYDVLEPYVARPWYTAMPAMSRKE